MHALDDDRGSRDATIIISLHRIINAARKLPEKASRARSLAPRSRVQMAEKPMANRRKRKRKRVFLVCYIRDAKYT